MLGEDIFRVQYVAAFGLIALGIYVSHRKWVKLINFEKSRGLFVLTFLLRKYQLYPVNRNFLTVFPRICC